MLPLLAICETNHVTHNRDPDLVRRIGAATALELRATGIPYTFAPCIAVTQSHVTLQANTEKVLKEKELIDRLMYICTH